MTIGYLGDCPSSSINIIADELRLLAPTAIRFLETRGIGGASTDINGKSELLKPGMGFALTRPRVLWLSLLPTNELIDFRNVLVAVATTVGADLSYLRPTFAPHLTLGSAGPDDGADWSRFDIHDLPKVASLEAVQISIEVAVIQITNTKTAPASIATIRRFDNE